MSVPDPSKESVINDTSSITLTTTELTSTNTSTDCVVNEVTVDTTTPLQTSTTTTTTTTTTTPLQTSTTTTTTEYAATTTTTTTGGVGGGNVSVGLPSHDLSTVPIINDFTNITASRVESVSGICRLDTLPQEPSTVS